MKNFIIRKKYNGWKIEDKTLQINKELKKYYFLSKNYFSKMNKGIMMDYESWYSVTPEDISNTIIDTIENYTDKTNKITVLCAFSGVGGDAVVFLNRGYDVIALDMHYSKIKYLKTNWSIYKKESKNPGNLFCLVNDFFKVELSDFNGIKPLIAFISPPWGGVTYRKNFSMEFIALKDIFNKTLELVENVIFYMPADCNKDEIRDVMGEECQIRYCKRGSRQIATFLFYGPLFKKDMYRNQK